MRSLFLLAAFTPLAPAQVDCPSVININQTDVAVGTQFMPVHDTGTFVEFQGALYFLARNDTHGTKAWKTDGTLAGTIPAFDEGGLTWNGPSPADLTVAGNQLFYRHAFLLEGTELYVSDGVTPVLNQVVDLAPAGVDGALDILGALGNSVVFSGWSASANHELWVSDGTAAGTLQLRDIWPGNVTSAPQHGALDPSGSVLYFSANDGVNGRELWRTDGTPSGTYLLKDIDPAAGTGSNPTGFFNWGGLTYFSASNGIHGVELWRTDGTPAGTQLFRDLDPTGDGAPNLARCFDLGGQFAFRATSAALGEELWISDGTAAGTVPWLDVNPGPAGSNLQPMGVLGGRVLFYADTPAGAGRLLSFDGINLTPLGDLERPDNVFDLEPPPLGVTLNGFHYLSARSGASGEVDVWGTNGTDFATVLVKDFEPGASSDPLDFAQVGPGAFVFTATTSGTGRELFVSDGTPDGTQLLVDLEPVAFPKNSSPRGLTVEAGARVYFAADDGVHGTELWQRDASGSVSMVRDVNPGGSGFAYNLHPHWDGTAWRTFMVANDGVHGFELWVTDGTEAGTQMVVDLLPGASNGALFTFAQVVNKRQAMASFNGEVYFAGAGPGATGYELFATDGTAAGTRLVADIVPGGNSNPDRFQVFDGALYFVVDENGTGVESLWKTDGTAAGTQLVASAAGLSGRIDDLIVVGDVLFFVGIVGLGSEGEELFAVSPGGAVTLVDDHWSGFASGVPRHLTAFDGRLVYTAATATGGDLMVVDPATLQPQVIVPLGGPAHVIAAADDWLYFGGQASAAGPLALGRWDGVGAVQPAGAPVLAFTAFGEAFTVGNDLLVVGTNLSSVSELYRVDAETGVVAQGCSQAALGTSPIEFAALSGSLVFTGYSENFGTELMQLELGAAQALDLGPSTAQLALSATAPHLGAALTLTIADTSLGTPGVLAWSLPVPAYATSLLAVGQAAWLDPATLQPIKVFVGGGPQVVTATVPGTPGLAGLTVNLQALELPGAAFPATASNGLALTLGN